MRSVSACLQCSVHERAQRYKHRPFPAFSCDLHVTVAVVRSWRRGRESEITEPCNNDKTTQYWALQIRDSSPYAMAGLPIGEETQAENEKRLDLDSNVLTASTTDSSYPMPQRSGFFPSLF